MKLSRTLLPFIGAAACCCGPALAGLGGDVASVESDRARMKGELRVSSAENFSVHEIDAPGGMRIREYLSDGIVFAVSWHGPGIPDLHQMLGSYYDEFKQAASVPHYNHHHLSVQTPDVVVQSSGHARSFSGRAWLPTLLPQNFSPNDIN